MGGTPLPKLGRITPSQKSRSNTYIQLRINDDHGVNKTGGTTIQPDNSASSVLTQLTRERILKSGIFRRSGGQTTDT